MRKWDTSDRTVHATLHATVLALLAVQIVSSLCISVVLLVSVVWGSYLTRIGCWFIQVDTLCLKRDIVGMGRMPRMIGVLLSDWAGEGTKVTVAVQVAAGREGG